MSKEVDRTRRVADLIQRELAVIINRESAIARKRLLTITAVKVTRDYSIATVYITLFDETDLKAVLKEFNEQARSFRHLLAQKINMRTTPQLRFVYDETIAYSRKMGEIIKKVTGKAVDAYADANGWCKAVFESLDVVSVIVMSFLVASLACMDLCFKAVSLIEWIVKFGKAVSNFHAARK